MPELECPRCGHRWLYRGRMRHYASCPDCKHPVPITPPPTQAKGGSPRRGYAGDRREVE